MAKKRFDPDALQKAGLDIAKKHKQREKSTVVTPKKAKSEKTQLCRIGISYHRRLKFAAVKNDMTIRQYLENLIEKNIPKE